MENPREYGIKRRRELARERQRRSRERKRNYGAGGTEMAQFWHSGTGLAQTKRTETEGNGTERKAAAVLQAGTNVG